MNNNNLISWASHSITKDDLMFDKILDIHDDVFLFLTNNNLKLKIDNELFLMHLFLFIYNNSYHA